MPSQSQHPPQRQHTSQSQHTSSSQQTSETYDHALQDESVDAVHIQPSTPDDEEEERLVEFKVYLQDEHSAHRDAWREFLQHRMPLDLERFRLSSSHTHVHQDSWADDIMRITVFRPDFSDDESGERRRSELRVSEDARTRVVESIAAYLTGINLRPFIPYGDLESVVVGHDDSILGPATRNTRPPALRRPLRQRITRVLRMPRRGRFRDFGLRTRPRPEPSSGHSTQTPGYARNVRPRR